MNDDSLPSNVPPPNTLKKKRGRKPKNEIVETPIVPSSSKRGRKPKLNPNSSQETKKNVELDDNLIIHLPVKSSDISEMLDINTITDNKVLSPKPYETENNYAYIDPKLTSAPSKISGSKYGHKCIQNDIRLINTNIEFYDSNTKERLPDKTHQHCLWCSCGFDTKPVSLPISKIENKFYVRGCFCSFNCALAYNFDKNFSDKWEYSSLLHLLYKTIHKKYVKIIPAPPKELLKIYGGALTIDEYRKNMITNDVSYNILHPPIVSILPIIEEVSNTDKMKNDLYVPLNLDLIDRSSLSIKSKLVKQPQVNNVQQTLQSYMDLSVSKC